VTLRRTLFAVALWFGVIAVFGIAIGRAITGPLDSFVTHHFDTPIRTFVTRQNEPVWHHLLAHVSALGTAFVTGAVAVVTGGVWSARTRRPTAARQCATAFVGAALLTIIVKFGVHRDPASGPLPSFTAGSFPSGHALFAVSVYGTIAVLTLRSSLPRAIRVTVATLIVVVALAVGWSRVFLLDHYASDVVGSLVLGVAWVAVVVSDGDLRRDARTARETPESGEKAHPRALSRNPVN
jgi:membrane-associated phospholipid phosphatase